MFFQGMDRRHASDVSSLHPALSAGTTSPLAGNRRIIGIVDCRIDDRMSSPTAQVKQLEYRALSGRQLLGVD
jgi:hypothetical protein